MEFALTIFLIPVLLVIAFCVWLLYRACKPYWDEPDEGKKPAGDQ